MRCRALDANGDMTFGRGGANFLVDSPAAVAQLAENRLLLMEREWFLDVLDGTRYATRILGKNTQQTRDGEVRARILGTTGMLGIASYSSQVQGRAFNVAATVDTIFGQASIRTAFGPAQPLTPAPDPAPPPVLPAVLFGELDFSNSAMSGWI